MALLDEIEQLALAVYAEHGLPVRHGHYGRSPRATSWTFISHYMSPEDRWRTALEKPKWRFARLEDLADRATSPAPLRQAGKMLAICTAIRNTIRTRLRPSLAEEFEAAIRLGYDWGAMRKPTSLRSGAPLRFTSVNRTRAPKP